MKYSSNDYYPGKWNTPASSVPPKQKKSRINYGILIPVVCLLIVAGIMTTFTLTSSYQQKQYNRQLDELAKKYEQTPVLPSTPGITNPVTGDGSFDKLDLFAELFRYYGYYAGDVSEEEFVDSVLRAYAAATGDKYAAYYTETEFQNMMKESAGDIVGIGITSIESVVDYNGSRYTVFDIIDVYNDTPAGEAGLRAGDVIAAVKVDGSYRTLSQLGGYDAAIGYIRGVEGTTVEIQVLRPEGDGYAVLEFSLVRRHFVAKTVLSYLNENDDKTGVVRILSFDMTTPAQFKQAVLDLKEQGVERFVLDLRNNPGGDLQSLKAVVSYFLKENDLIISVVDRTGAVVGVHNAIPYEGTGSYAACNVAKEEIGMFADLSMVVLCNERTASAAEAFASTLRDYGMAELVGTKTYGKGTMQTFLPLARYGNYTGYFKMTTYAYLTKSGVSYNGIGIVPDETVEQSEEAQNYNFNVLPQSKDTQLQAAFERIQK